MACLESLSTTTRMAVKPVDEGSCSMKSKWSSRASLVWEVVSAIHRVYGAVS